MQLDEDKELALRDLVGSLNRLVPRDGAHLMLAGDANSKTTVGNRAGYMRLGVELLTAALLPLSGSDTEPPRIEPDLDYLLTPGSRSPFTLCEIDESIVSRPPVASGLGLFGQLVAGVLIVAAIALLVGGVAFVLRWIFGGF
jgi:hypothetical protein